MILDPNNKPLLVILKAIRNGAVYGTKIRFPHALVMIFLFRSGTFQQKAQAIFKATRQHATNLAKFAFLYKSSMLALRTANGGKPAAAHSFLAGLLGGYTVFGQGANARSNVSQQIVIYLFARVVLALASLAVQPPGENALVGSAYGPHGGIGLLRLSPENTERLKTYSWPVFASLSWAGVMWLFETYPETLQPSLRASMVYMYVLVSSCALLHTLLTCLSSSQLRQRGKVGFRPQLPVAQPMITNGIRSLAAGLLARRFTAFMDLGQRTVAPVTYEEVNYRIGHRDGMLLGNLLGTTVVRVAIIENNCYDPVLAFGYTVYGFVHQIESLHDQRNKHNETITKNVHHILQTPKMRVFRETIYAPTWIKTLTQLMCLARAYLSADKMYGMTS